MTETMYAAPGVGLAATQVDVHKQIIVIDVSEDRSDLRVFVNPEITRREGVAVNQEGCLSVPGIYDNVERAESVTVTALDRNGARFTLNASGLLADLHPARDGPPARQGLRRATCRSSSRTASARSSRSASARPPDSAARPCASSSRARPPSPRAPSRRSSRAGPRSRPRPHPTRPSRRARAAARRERRGASRRAPWRSRSPSPPRFKTPRRPRRPRATPRPTSWWSRHTGCILPRAVLDDSRPRLPQHPRLAAAALARRRADPARDPRRRRANRRLHHADGRGPRYRPGAARASASRSRPRDTAGTLTAKPRSAWCAGRSSKRSRGSTARAAPAGRRRCATYAAKIDKAEARIDWKRRRD